MIRKVKMRLLGKLQDQKMHRVPALGPQLQSSKIFYRRFENGTNVQAAVHVFLQ
jgi:hypothetical protein